jgi:16S rRNA G966 N2-methylase RsmD
VYRKAIFEKVKPGHVVLDAGAGSGILSIFAANAGARKVYAVERTDIAELAREMMKINGVQNTVEVIQGDLESVELPEKVDVIVSETLGQLGLDENVLPAFLVARDRWLKPNGKMLPERVVTWMAPIEDVELEKDRAFWNRGPYGVDLRLLASGAGEEVYYGKLGMNMDDLLAEPQKVLTNDSYTDSSDEARRPFHSSLSFLITRKGRLSALAGWFSAEFENGLILTNAPGAPANHWGIAEFTMGRAIDVYPGLAIDVEITLEPIGGDMTFKWSMRIGNEPWEHHEEKQRTILKPLNSYETSFWQHGLPEV